jgi:hypothetical protein
VVKDIEVERLAPVTAEIAVTVGESGEARLVATL